MSTHDNPRFVKLGDVLEVVKSVPCWLMPNVQRSAVGYRVDVLRVLEAMPPEQVARHTIDHYGDD